MTPDQAVTSSVLERFSTLIRRNSKKRKTTTANPYLITTSTLLLLRVGPVFRSLSATPAPPHSAPRTPPPGPPRSGPRPPAPPTAGRRGARSSARELLRQAVSLAAGAEPEDDSVQCASSMRSKTLGLLGRVVLLEDRFDLLPQLVRHAPDRRSRLLFGWAFGHRGLLFARVAEDSNRSKG